ncbi:MAG: hypothetical protein NTV51_19765 [Verrucomicrobia bacterium]|nr:hypothetical protein [Verrucomicrobiota bacterium]
MSEFSESYHLRSLRRDDACDVLRAAGLAGYVYPAANGWVSFVAKDGAFEPDQRIVGAARLPLLHYVSAEDHGWSFSLFDRGRVVCAYHCDWNNDITFDDTRYSRAVLQKIVSSAGSAALEAFEKLLRPNDFEELMETEASKVFAQAVGLEHYDWLNYDYIARDFHESPKDFRDVIEIK